jgi:hypothetical protein
MKRLVHSVVAVARQVAGGPVVCLSMDVGVAEH